MMKQIIQIHQYHLPLTLSNWFFLFLLGSLLTACKDTNSRQTPEVTAKDSIPTVPSAPATPTNDQVTLYAWVDGLRVREAADKQAKIVAEIKEGGRLTFLQEQSDFTEKINLRGTLYDEPWLLVATESGQKGWVYGGGVKFYAPKVDLSDSPYDDCLALQRAGQWEKAEGCIEKIQRQQLKANARWVKETEKEVIITLLNGQQVTFKSEVVSMEEEHLIYNYRYYIPQMGYHVLYTLGFEWSGYLLVNDKSGKTIELPGYPKPSPDFKHLMVSNLDLEAGFEYNGIGLWGFTEEGLEMIYKKEMDRFGPLLPIWLDNETVEMTLIPSASDETGLQKKKVQLIVQNGDWVLMD